MGNYGQYSLVFNKKELNNLQQEFKIISEITLNHNSCDKNKNFNYKTNLSEIVANLRSNKE